MQILKPIVHETVWGGSKLTPFSGSTCEKIGHLYACIDNSSFKSEIISGSFSGKNIHDWFISNRKRYGLENYDELPVLMALVEAADNLSIQVHPDDEMAKRLIGKTFGKNESFFTIEPPESGYMYNGCTASSKQDMARLISEARCLEGVDTLAIRKGDYVYVTGGTLHAASRGSLSFEIEENCDATYRFFDFNRIDKNVKKRPLQVEKALACLNIHQKSSVRQYNGEEQIVERMYSTQHLVGKKNFKNNESSFIIAVLIKGSKQINLNNLLPGCAVILEPGDQIDLDGCEWIFVRVF